MLELLEAMGPTGLEAVVITYNAVISVCEKGTPIEKALEFLEA